MLYLDIAMHSFFNRFTSSLSSFLRARTTNRLRFFPLLSLNNNDFRLSVTLPLLIFFLLHSLPNQSSLIHLFITHRFDHSRILNLLAEKNKRATLEVAFAPSEFDRVTFSVCHFQNNHSLDVELGFFFLSMCTSSSVSPSFIRYIESKQEKNKLGRAICRLSRTLRTRCINFCISLTPWFHILV